MVGGSTLRTSHNVRLEVEGATFKFSKANHHISFKESNHALKEAKATKSTPTSLLIRPHPSNLTVGPPTGTKSHTHYKNWTTHHLVSLSKEKLPPISQVPIQSPQTLPKMASSKLRSSSYFPYLLLSFLNFVVLLLSSASFAPTILIKSPPTPFGWAVIATSSLSLLSSFVGFYSVLTHACFVTHISILLASLAGQGLGFLVLFSREETSLRLLKADKGHKEARTLAKVECGLLLSMFLLQLVVLVSTCTVQSCWVREYTGLEAEKEEMARRRGRRLARVQEESVANAKKIAEIQGKETDEKTKNTYGQWVKTDFEG